MKKLKQVLKALSFLIFISPLFFGVSCAENKETEFSRSDWNVEKDMDKTTGPGIDFYQYAVGSWLKANPLKPETDMNGTISDCETKSDSFLSSIISTGSKDIALDKITSELKTAETDWENQIKIPADRLLFQISSAKTKDDLIPVFAQMIREGYSPVMSITFTPVAREVETLLQLGRVETLYQDGLPEDYYILAALNTNTGIDQRLSSIITEANVITEARRFITKLETGINLSDSKANKKISSNLKANNYAYKILHAAGFTPAQLEKIKYVGILDTYLKNLDKSSLSELKSYLSLIVYDEMYRFSKNISLLGDSAIYENFEYMLKKRDFAKYNLLKNAAENNVSSETKDKITKMMEEIRDSFIQRSYSIDWMSDATKAKAREKAKNMEFFVAYPEKYNKDFLIGDFTQTNCFDDIHSFESKLFSAHLKNINNTSEGALWALFPTIANPLQFNAYYHNVNNYVIINPFTCCQPVCDFSKGDAYSYGVLGFILGHEFTHAFDSVGANYDKNGTEKNWWTADDKTNFLEKQKQFIDLFSKYDIFSGLINENGELNDGEATLLENMADFGGLTLAHQAYMNKKQKETKEPEMLMKQERDFFLATAQCYKGNQSNTFKLRAKDWDIHSNFKIRINGNVLNMPSWYTVFDIQETDNLYLPPNERIVLW